jgi:phage baseplate assembly protein W
MSTSIHTKLTIPARPNPTISGPHMYRGFSTVNKNTKNFALYDFELIKQDLLNSFYVRQGERLMNPTIGCVIWDLLFEPLTESVKDLILQNVNAILGSDPRVQASNVTITQYDTGLQLQCKLTYTLYNLSENLQLKFDQANGLTTSQVSV